MHDFDEVFAMTHTHSITCRPATPADWPAIAALLTQAELPLAGADEHLADFTLAISDDGALAGLAGMEIYGDVALLRSVAVAERGQGLGQALVREVIAAAQARGIRQIALLTTTAAGFFPRFGFRPVERSDMPEALHASREFQGACPASAVAMLADL